MVRSSEIGIQIYHNLTDMAARMSIAMDLADLTALRERFEKESKFASELPDQKALALMAQIVAVYEADAGEE